MSGHIGIQTNWSGERRKSLGEKVIVGGWSPKNRYVVENKDVGVDVGSEDGSLLYSSQSSLSSVSDSYDPIVVLEDDEFPSLDDRFYARRSSYVHPVLQTTETYSDEEYLEDYTMMSETERRWRRVDKKLEEIQKKTYNDDLESSSSSLSSSPRWTQFIYQVINPSNWLMIQYLFRSNDVLSHFLIPN